jgi:hypothetical protein
MPEECRISAGKSIVTKRSYLVCHIALHSLARHCSRHIVVGEASKELAVNSKFISKCLLESIRMGSGEEGVVGIHSRLVGEAVRNSEVCKELARKTEMEEP